MSAPDDIEPKEPSPPHTGRSGFALGFGIGALVLAAVGLATSLLPFTAPLGLLFGSGAVGMTLICLYRGEGMSVGIGCAAAAIAIAAVFYSWSWYATNQQVVKPPFYDLIRQQRKR